MFKIIICIFLKISFIITIKSTDSTNLRQKIMKSLYEDLSIKNVLVVKSTSPKSDIFFTKSLSKLNIYSSSLTPKEMDKLLDKHHTQRLNFVKTIVLLNQEDLAQILTVKNERAVYRFSWISWDTFSLPNIDLFYIPYHTQFLIVENLEKEKYKISEIYHSSIYDGTMMKCKQDFGSWTDKNGLIKVEENFYQRRLNMNGSYFVFISKKGEINNAWVDLVGNIIRIMNFRPTGRRVEDFYNKTVLAELPWELSLSLSVFDSAFGYFPYVIGYLLKIENYLFIKYDTTFEQNGLLLHTHLFSTSLWLSIFISIITAMIGTTIMIIIKRKFKKSREMGFISAGYFSIEAFTNQDGGETPTSTSTRIMVTTIRLTTLFIVPAYSAAILTSILIPQTKLPFTDIQGFVQDGSYKLGYPKTIQYDKWFNRRKDVWSKTAYENFLLNQEKMPENFNDQLKKICEYDKVAFISDPYVMSKTICKAIKIPVPLTKAWQGLMLRRSSPYGRIFNKIFKSIISSGVLNKHLQEDENRKKLEDIRAVKLENIQQILMLIFILYFISILILIAEIFLKRMYEI